MNEGNLLIGFIFLIKKLFLLREIKEWFYFIELVCVNGSFCDIIEEYEIVLKDIFFC